MENSKIVNLERFHSCNVFISAAKQAPHALISPLDLIGNLSAQSNTSQRIVKPQIKLFEIYVGSIEKTPRNGSCVIEAAFKNKF